MKINKKFLQFIAALAILVFHLGIPVTSADTFLMKIGYIGVDIFFFLSAYSLADKEIDYTALLKNRFFNIYLKFLIFVVIAAIYKGYSLLRVVKVLTLIEFFEKGGGAFLWYVPAIVLFYLIYPFFVKWNSKYKSLITLAAWLLVSVILDKLIGYNKIFIFTNRLPVILAGYELKKRSIPKWVAPVFLPVGVILTYIFGYTVKLGIPFSDFYFVTNLLLAVSICLLSGYIKNAKIWNVLGSATLELYCLQMIFGTKFTTWLYRTIGNRVLTNLVMIVTMYIAAWLIAMLLNKIILKRIN